MVVATNGIRIFSRLKHKHANPIELMKRLLDQGTHIRPIEAAEAAAQGRDGYGSNPSRPDLPYQGLQPGFDIPRPALLPPFPDNGLTLSCAPFIDDTDKKVTYLGQGIEQLDSRKQDRPFRQGLVSVPFLNDMRPLFVLITVT